MRGVHVIPLVCKRQSSFPETGHETRIQLVSELMTRRFEDPYEEYQVPNLRAMEGYDKLSGVTGGVVS